MSKVVQSFPVTVEDNPPPEQLENPVPIVKNHTALDDRLALEDESNPEGGNKKMCILTDFYK